MVGCDCPVCRSREPKNKRCRTHIHVEMGGLNIQVDAAQEFRLQAIRMGIPKVDLVLLTHGHADHILGFDDLRRYCDQRDGYAIPVYSNEEGIERLRAIFPYAIREKSIVRGYPAFEPRQMPERLDLGGAGVVESTIQSHGAFETLGLVFREAVTGASFAYFTDCNSVSEHAAALAAGVDLAVIDGLRSSPHPSHMNFDEAIEAARRIAAKRTLIIHMTHERDHEELDRMLPENVSPAYDGLVVKL